MRVLLDTHIWLWSLLEPERLNEKVTAVLCDPDTEIRLSPVSTWEALALIRKGRVEVDGAPALWITQALRQAPLLEAPLTHEVAIESDRFADSHADPTDRFLAATARVYELTLVTADRRLIESQGELQVLANR